MNVVDKRLAGTFDNKEPLWFDWELDFPQPFIRTWFQENKHLSIYIGLAYVAATLWGRKIMENHKRFELRGLLFAWNVIMAAFSLFLSVRLVPFFVRRLYNSTVYGAVCDGSYEPVMQITMWLSIFAASKPVEFVDTVFIVLRKQHLAFIHWYHHATVVVVCWFALGSHRGPANCIYYVTMNSVVHAIMYTYYGLKSIRVPVPRFINMVITSMQIAQMIVGILINILAAYYTFFRPDMPCDDEPLQIYVALGVYMSYFFLFCRFFYNAYLRKSVDTTSKTD